MKYYVTTIEQIKQVNQETGKEELAEYGKTTKKNTEDSALSFYYDALSTVSAEMDRGGAHTYMKITLDNSIGGHIKGESLGQYLEALPSPEQYIEITDPDAVAEDAVEYYVLINGAYIEDEGVQVGDRVYGKYVKVESEEA